MGRKWLNWGRIAETTFHYEKKNPQISQISQIFFFWFFKILWLIYLYEER